MLVVNGKRTLSFFLLGLIFIKKCHKKVDVMKNMRKIASDCHNTTKLHNSFFSFENWNFLKKLIFLTCCWKNGVNARGQHVIILTLLSLSGISKRKGIYERTRKSPLMYFFGFGIVCHKTNVINYMMASVLRGTF